MASPFEERDADTAPPASAPEGQTDAQSAPPPPAPDEETPATQGQTLSVFDLRVGDCLIEVTPDPNLEVIETVPCAEAHSAQVVSTFELPHGPWPGMDEVTTRAQARCPADLRGLPTPTAGLEAFFLHPTERSWRFGDRGIICLAVSTAPRRGSLPVL